MIEKQPHAFRPKRRSWLEEKLKEEMEVFRKEAGERAIGYIVGGFGVIAGLAWNEAIKTVIEYLFPLDKSTVLAKFVYAILMTGIVVIVAVYLSRFLRRDQTPQ